MVPLLFFFWWKNKLYANISKFRVPKWIQSKRKTFLKLYRYINHEISSIFHSYLLIKGSNFVCEVNSESKYDSSNFHQNGFKIADGQNLRRLKWLRFYKYGLIQSVVMRNMLYVSNVTFVKVSWVSKFLSSLRIHFQ